TSSVPAPTAAHSSRSPRGVPSATCAGSRSAGRGVISFPSSVVSSISAAGFLAAGGSRISMGALHGVPNMGTLSTHYGYSSSQRRGRPVRAGPIGGARRAVPGVLGAAAAARDRASRQGGHGRGAARAGATPPPPPPRPPPPRPPPPLPARPPRTPRPP